MIPPVEKDPRTIFLTVSLWELQELMDERELLSVKGTILMNIDKRSHKVSDTSDPSVYAPIIDRKQRWLAGMDQTKYQFTARDVSQIIEDIRNENPKIKSVKEILKEIENGISAYETEHKSHMAHDDCNGMYIPINVVRRLIEVRKNGKVQDKK